MKALTRSSPPAPSRLLLHALIRAYEYTIGAVAAYMIEYRKAQVAERLHSYLSRLSDKELAARGLDRRQLAQFIRQRLY
jgi:hypothetical protein